MDWKKYLTNIERQKYEHIIQHYEQDKAIQFIRHLKKGKLFEIPALLFYGFQQIDRMTEKFSISILDDFHALCEYTLHEKTLLQVAPSKEMIHLFCQLYKDAYRDQKEAQFQLAELYRQNGWIELAVKWYEFSAQNGHGAAYYWLGNLVYDGEYLPFDLAKCFHYYEKSAQSGYPDGLNNYADMYLRGEHVEKDVEKAYMLFKEAAQKGVCESMYTIGYMYENGVGTVQNTELSQYWYEQSALNGDVFGQNKLGNEAFQNGDGQLAVRWYEMAVAQQDIDGQVNLGTCYELGVGVKRDIKKAKHYYRLAALQGDVEAKEKLNALKNSEV